MKKNVLVICPTMWDRRELKQDAISSKYNFVYHDYDFRILEGALIGNEPVKTDIKKMISDLVTLSHEKKIDGIISTNDYPGSSLASIVARSTGNRGPDPELVLRLQHKYYSRLLQSKYIAQSVPKYYVTNKTHMSDKKIPFSFPMFVKPIKSKFSIGAGPAETKKDLAFVLEKAFLSKSFLEPFNTFLGMYNDFTVDANHVMIEEKLEGNQVTLEGFVYSSDVHIIGIVDSIMHPNKISFKRFEYPSSLSIELQERIKAIGHHFIKAIGYDNGFFNIEFMHNPVTDKIYIIEINPRMANQFADLYEKVDGTNTYITQLAIATGQKTTYEFNNGKYAIAASFPLRVFENQRITKVPSKKIIQRLYKEFPDIRINTWFKEGQLLSEDSQDDYSYLYALVHLGAVDKQELLEKFDYANNLLGYEFAPII